MAKLARVEALAQAAVVGVDTEPAAREGRALGGAEARDAADAARADAPLARADERAQPLERRRRRRRRLRRARLGDRPRREQRLAVGGGQRRQKRRRVEEAARLGRAAREVVDESGAQRLRKRRRRRRRPARGGGGRAQLVLQLDRREPRAADPRVLRLERLQQLGRLRLGTRPVAGLRGGGGVAQRAAHVAAVGVPVVGGVLAQQRGPAGARVVPPVEALEQPRLEAQLLLRLLEQLAVLLEQRERRLGRLLAAQHLEVQPHLGLEREGALLARPLEHRRRELQLLRRARPRAVVRRRRRARKLGRRVVGHLQQHAGDGPEDVALLAAGGELLVHLHREALRLLVLPLAQVAAEQRVRQLLVALLLLPRLLVARGAVLPVARRLEGDHERVEQRIVGGRLERARHLAAERERLVGLAGPFERHGLERLDERRVALLQRGVAQLER